METINSSKLMLVARSWSLMGYNNCFNKYNQLNEAQYRLEYKMVKNPHLDSITSDILGPKGSYWIKNKSYIKYNFALRLFQ